MASALCVQCLALLGALLLLWHALEHAEVISAFSILSYKQRRCGLLSPCRLSTILHTVGTPSACNEGCLACRGVAKMWPKRSALQTSHSTCHGGQGEYRPGFSEFSVFLDVQQTLSHNRCSGMPVGGTMQTSS